MNRAEFMGRLTELLGDVSPMEREEAIQYYNDYFDDAGEENEGSVIASLGTPEELARTIKTGLNDSGSGGEFTESGFSGYAQAPKDEVIRAEDADTAGRSGSNGAWTGNEPGGSTHSGNDYYDGAYYRRPEGDGIYGGRKDTRTYSNPYENAGTQSASYEQNGSRHSANGQNHTYGTSYGQGSANDTAYGQPEGQSASYSQSGSGKEPMSGGMIALIAIVAVLTSPVWIGLLGGLFGVAVGVIATLFALFLSFLIVGVVLVAVAAALLITGISVLFGMPAAALCLIGSSLVVFAVGLVFIWLMALMAGTAIPACVRGIVSLCQRIFHRGGARA